MGYIKFCLLFSLIVSLWAHSEDKPFTVGYTPQYPFIWQGESGEVKGIYVDILSETLENRLGFSINYRPYPPLRLEHTFERGKIDARISVKSDQHMFNARTGIPIAVGMISIFTNKNHPKLDLISNIDLISDIKGLSVLAINGDQWISSFIDKSAIDSQANSYSQLMKKLALGRGDIAVVDEIIGFNTIYEENLAKDLVLASRLTADPLVHRLLISPKSNYSTLSSKISDTIIEALNNGTTATIYEKYRKHSEHNLLGAIEKSKIRFVHHFYGPLNDAIHGIAGKYNQRENAHKIKPLYLDFVSYKDTIRYGLLNQSPPELIMTWAGFRMQFLVDNQLITPLTFAKETLNQFDNKTLSSVSNGADLYAIPWNHHIISLISNKKVLKKYNVSPPKNWGEMLATCEILDSKGITPFALGAREKWTIQYWFDYLLLRTAGKDFRNNLLKGDVSLTHPKIKRVFSLWAELIEKKCIDQNSRDFTYWGSMVKLAEGSAAYTLMGTWAISLLNNEFQLAYGKDIEIANFPMVDENIPSHTMSIVDAIARTKSDKNIPIESVLRYLSSEDPQLVFSSESSGLAPNNNIDKNKYSELQEKIHELSSNSSIDVAPFDLSTPPLVSEVGLNLFSQFLIDPKSIDSLLVFANKELQEAFVDQVVNF